MKASVNNSAAVANSVSINKDMLNKKKAMKYVKKDIMVESLNLLQGVLVSMGILKEEETREFTVKSPKEEMISCYEEYVTLYTQVTEPKMFEEEVKDDSKTEEPANPETSTEEPVNEPKTEEEGPTQAEIEANIKKYIKPAQPVKTEEEIKADNEKKASEKDKKADKKQDTPKEHKCKTGTAQERLDKYTKELNEKEELAKDEKKLEAMNKEDRKALRHRIASLKRKIERANRALSTKPENK